MRTPNSCATAREPKQARMRAAMTFLADDRPGAADLHGRRARPGLPRCGRRISRRSPRFGVPGRIKRLIAVRKAEPALRRGDWVEVEAGGPVYAFIRVLDQERVLVVLNASNEARTMRLPFGVKPWREFRLDDLITDRLAKPRRGRFADRARAVRGTGAQDTLKPAARSSLFERYSRRPQRCPKVSALRRGKLDGTSTERLCRNLGDHNR